MVIDLSQYPHFLYYLETTEATRDKFGGWTPGGLSRWKSLGPCRLERNGQAASIPTTDGKLFVFSGIVYMPQQTEIKPLPIGTRVIVSREPLETARTQEPETEEEEATETEPELTLETLTAEAIAEKTAAGIILIDKPNATFEVGRLHNRMWL